MVPHPSANQTVHGRDLNLQPVDHKSDDALTCISLCCYCWYTSMSCFRLTGCQCRCRAAVCSWLWYKESKDCSVVPGCYPATDITAAAQQGRVLYACYWQLVYLLLYQCIHNKGVMILSHRVVFQALPLGFKTTVPWDHGIVF